MRKAGLPLLKLRSPVKLRFLAMATAALMLVGAAPIPPDVRPEVGNRADTQQRLEVYGELPLIFEANQGQTDARVDFLSRGRGYTLFLTPTEAVISLVLPESGQGMGPEISTAFSASGPLAPPVPPATPAIDARRRVTTLRMKLLGANAQSGKVGLEELPGKVNHFLGSDSATWRSNVATYAKVGYRDVYPGVDLVYYGNQRRLEYDFVVAPGADPEAITLSFEGVDRLDVDARGDLVLRTAGQPVLRLQRPLIYQDIDGVRQTVSGAYAIEGTHRVSFLIGAYDTAKPLVIDPVFAYATHLGGGAGDTGYAIAVDASGSAYVTGATNSADFPLEAPMQGAYGGSTDVFVSKFSADGSELLYTTYFGGSRADLAYAIALDAAGDVYVTGDTQSTDFPLVNPVQAALGGSADVFVAKLSGDGSNLVYSTYLGGRVGDRGQGIAVDAAGSAYVTGFSNSTDFPLVDPMQTTFAGGPGTAFVLKLNPSGSALIYSTYLGGSRGFPDLGYAIAVDAAGNAYVTGLTNSVDFPTVNPIQSFGGQTDVFVAKLNPSGSELIYSTFLGGPADDEGMSIAVDAAGHAYVTGDTESMNFPVTAGAYRTSCTPFLTNIPIGALCSGGDVFVSKLSVDGSALVYSTYVSGNNYDVGLGIALDSAGNAYVAGFTGSDDFPTINAVQKAYGGERFDAFVMKLNPSGSALIYATFLGGSREDGGYGIALDDAGNAYVTGFTLSPDFPSRNPLSSASVGSRDAFVAKITD